MLGPGDSEMIFLMLLFILTPSLLMVFPSFKTWDSSPFLQPPFSTGALSSGRGNLTSSLRTTLLALPGYWFVEGTDECFPLWKEKSPIRGADCVISSNDLGSWVLGIASEVGFTAFERAMFMLNSKSNTLIWMFKRFDFKQWNRIWKISVFWKLKGKSESY